MELTTIEKIKTIMRRKGMTNTDLAKATNQTPQNLSNKMSRGDLRESEIREFADFLGCDIEINFIDRNE